MKISTPGEIVKILVHWCDINSQLGDLEPTGRDGDQFWEAEYTGFEIIALPARMRLRVEVTKLVKFSSEMHITAGKSSKPIAGDTTLCCPVW